MSKCWLRAPIRIFCMAFIWNVFSSDYAIPKLNPNWCAISTRKSLYFLCISIWIVCSAWTWKYEMIGNTQINHILEWWHRFFNESLKDNDLYSVFSIISFWFFKKFLIAWKKVCFCRHINMNRFNRLFYLLFLSIMNWTFCFVVEWQTDSNSIFVFV